MHRPILLLFPFCRISPTRTTAELPIPTRPLGALQSFTLLESTPKSRRDRAQFAGGSIIWTFELTADGGIIALEPKEE